MPQTSPSPLCWICASLLLFTLPHLVSAQPPAPTARRIAAGYQHTLVVKSDGTVWAFGSGNAGGAPSSTDIANANADLDVTTNQYRPHFLANPCGLIYRYQGPDAASWSVLADRTDSPIRCSP